MTQPKPALRGDPPVVWSTPCRRLGLQCDLLPIRNPQPRLLQAATEAAAGTVEDSELSGRHAAVLGPLQGAARTRAAMSAPMLGLLRACAPPVLPLPIALRLLSLLSPQHPTQSRMLRPCTVCESVPLSVATRRPCPLSRQLLCQRPRVPPSGPHTRRSERSCREGSVPPALGKLLFRVVTTGTRRDSAAAVAALRGLAATDAAPLETLVLPEQALVPVAPLVVHEWLPSDEDIMAVRCSCLLPRGSLCFRAHGVRALGCQTLPVPRYQEGPSGRTTSRPGTNRVGGVHCQGPTVTCF